MIFFASPSLFILVYEVVNGCQEPLPRERRERCWKLRVTKVPPSFCSAFFFLRVTREMSFSSLACSLGCPPRKWAVECRSSRKLWKLLGGLKDVCIIN